MRHRSFAALGAAVLVAAVVQVAEPSGVAAAATPVVPRPDHVVVVVEENRASSQIVGDPAAPYITSLASSGANFTAAYGETHPSEPNYLALFSGSTQGLTDDSCPHSYSTPSLGDRLLAAGRTFVGYSESLPSVGWAGCASGPYARKHNPWVDFPAIPDSANQPFTAFPSDYSTLPDVSFVIPNLNNDMHDGSVAQGDAWLQANLGGYVQWAQTHNSLLVLTFDEDDGSSANHISTVITGQPVVPGQYGETINHYNLLRTIEEAFGLPLLGNSATAVPITDIWGGNRPPTASFTVSCPTLTCSFDAGGSADPDGTITGYAWDFGDGATGTGVTTTHTYAAGQYTATLTVTDDLGATASAKQVLLVGSTQPFALDSFNRTVTGGLGQADIGGNWSTSGSGSNYSVTPGSASLVLAKASAQLAATLPGVSRTDADVSAQLSAGPAPNGGPLYVTLDGRRVGSGNEYAAKALINPDRTVTLRIVRLVGGAETTVAGPVRVGTLTYSAGAVLDLRVQVTGTAPTQLRARAWADTDPEPGTWSLTAADTTAALQQPGTVGIVAYLSSAATNAPVTVTLRRFVGQPTTAANQPPSASFTASCAQLSCSFDGRASTDPDGTVAGWAWDFGDGATGTGATVAHAYAVAGTYTVTLTVTDGQGATGVATHSVTPTPPPVNQPPTAAFTVSCASLTCTVDGTTSSDDEGVQSWTWDFGDSTSGTGATTAHTYAAAGTYPITLTVADEDGQTGTVTQAVTVTAADPSFVIDNFARTVASGLGQADVGGTWSIAGTPSWFSVSNGTATARLPNPGNQVSGWLPSAARTDTDLQTSFAVTALPTGGPVYVTIEGRRVSSGNEYSAKLLVNANRTVSLFLIRVVGGTETTISPVVVLPGITYAAGQRIGVHLQVVGTGTTTVRARAWAASGAEPSTWTVSATDSTAALQSPGAVGMIAYLSRAITNAPMSVSFGPISARPTGA